jgi:hypothetical protein
MRRERILVGVVGCLLFSFAPVAPAAVFPGGYEAIVRRNVFGLQSPPLPRVTLEPNVIIELVGITDIFGDKRVVLVVAEKRGLAKSLILREGERQGEIQVLKVDEAAESVTVDNKGAVEVIVMGRFPRQQGPNYRTPSGSSL